MSDQRVTFGAVPLPGNFVGSPQQLFEAMLARMYMIVPFPSFVISDTMPTSNQGPWLREGREWWVWDENATPQATYVPQRLSYLLDQIWVGPTQPDPKDYQIWVKTAQSKPTEWWFYMGGNLGWATFDSVLQNGVITHEMLATSAVYRENIADGEVTAIKIQNDLPPSKLLHGTPYQVVQTNGEGTAVGNYDMFKNSGLKSWSVGQTVSFAHQLGRVPAIVQARLVCTGDEFGWSDGTEILLPQKVDYPQNSVAETLFHTPMITATTSNVSCYMPIGGIRLSGTFNGNGIWFDVITDAKWKLKIICSNG